MCELMGLSFERPTAAHFAMRAFAERCEENADGWGLAWYPDHAAAVVKEPTKWNESRLARFLETYHSLESPLYIAHVRHGTTGGSPRFADTHPFSREREGRDYTFAHNGTIAGPLRDLPTGRYRPLGGTDSEHVFCHILGWIDRRGGHLEDERTWNAFHELLADLNRWGSLNVLMTDGVRLLCYHDLGAWKGLSFRSFEHDPTIDCGTHIPGVNSGVVVATRPLDDGKWVSLLPRRAPRHQRGACRFLQPSHRRPAVRAPPFDG